MTTQQTALIEQLAAAGFAPKAWRDRIYLRSSRDLDVFIALDEPDATTWSDAWQGCALKVFIRRGSRSESQPRAWQVKRCQEAKAELMARLVDAAQAGILRSPLIAGVAPAATDQILTP